MNLNTLYQTAFLTGVIILLSACGQDYVAQKYYGTPYGNIRTAGAGVEYVRAHLAPQKGINITQQQSRQNVQTSPAYTMTEEYFKEFQAKPHSFKLEMRGDRWFLR